MIPIHSWIPRVWRRPPRYRLLRNRSWHLQPHFGPPQDLSCSQLTGDWAAVSGWMRKTMTDWMNRWNRDSDDEQRGLCQCGGKVSHLDPEITILLKKPEWLQWCTCAGKVSSCSRFVPGCLNLVTEGKRIHFSVGLKEGTKHGFSGSSKAAAIPITPSFTQKL